MKWYKHKTDLRNKRYIIDAMDLYGHQAYAFYNIMHEIYGEYYNETDECGQLTISMKNLRYNLRISEKKIRNLLTFFQNNHKILFRIAENDIIYKIPDFMELASNWTKRKRKEKLSTPAEGTTAIEERNKNKEYIINNMNEKNNVDDVDKTAVSCQPTAKDKDDMIKIIKRDAINIIKHLNETLNLEYRDTKFIEKRLREGENPEDFYLIIERMKENIFFKKNRHLYAPKYLFKKENFEIYLNQ